MPFTRPTVVRISTIDGGVGNLTIEFDSKAAIPLDNNQYKYYMVESELLFLQGKKLFPYKPIPSAEFEAGEAEVGITSRIGL